MVESIAAEVGMEVAVARDDGDAPCPTPHRATGRRLPDGDGKMKSPTFLR
jgi:hypothetical protein